MYTYRMVSERDPGVTGQLVVITTEHLPNDLEVRVERTLPASGPGILLHRTAGWGTFDRTTEQLKQYPGYGNTNPGLRVTDEKVRLMLGSGEDMVVEGVGAFEAMEPFWAGLGPGNRLDVNLEVAP